MVNTDIQFDTFEKDVDDYTLQETTTMEIVSISLIQNVEYGKEVNQTNT